MLTDSDVPVKMHITYQLMRFALAGGVGTIAHYLLLVSLVRAFGTGPVIASSFGAFIGALINYTLNYKYTFMSQKPHRESISRFLTVAVFGFILNAAVLSAAISQLGMHYIAGQIVAKGVVFIGSFTINRSWTF